MGLMNKFFNQTRKPEGKLGKMMLNGMNGGGHARLATFGMQLLPDEGPTAIAELGCGGGRNIAALLDKYPMARVTGVDYSPLSVETARAYNQSNAVRCEVVEGDITALALPAEAYDLATAFETVYFWGDLARAFANVYGILRKGGRFLIVNESDGRDKTGKKFEKIIDGMTVYTPEELQRYLQLAGFCKIVLTHHSAKPWIAVLAEK